MQPYRVGCHCGAVAITLLASEVLAAFARGGFIDVQPPLKKFPSDQPNVTPICFTNLPNFT